MTYFWQHNNFPNFQFDTEDYTSQFQEFAMELGEVNGLLHSLSNEEKTTLVVQTALSEAIKTSEIEGEYFSREDVFSSLQKQLGLVNEDIPIKNKKAKAIASLMYQVRQDYQKPLTNEMLQNWHRILMEFDKTVLEGKWRTSEEAMQIVSGRYGKIEIHFEAPPSKDIPMLMEQFINWYAKFPFQNLGKIPRAMLLAALAHLYFETVHPFEDGNGRIGRALSEKAVAEIVEIPVLLSISKSIEAVKKEYYQTLKEAQRQQNVSVWLQFFFKILINAQNETKKTTLFVLKKAKLLDIYKSQLNERQSKMFSKMTESNSEIFEGGITAKKYISITKTSKATATRDLQNLLEMDFLLKTGQGRSISYQINWE